MMPKPFGHATPSVPSPTSAAAAAALASVGDQFSGMDFAAASNRAQNGLQQELSRLQAWKSMKAMGLNPEEMAAMGGLSHEEMDRWSALERQLTNIDELSKSMA